MLLVAWAWTVTTVEAASAARARLSSSAIWRPVRRCFVRRLEMYAARSAWRPTIDASAAAAAARSRASRAVRRVSEWSLRATRARALRVRTIRAPVEAVVRCMLSRPVITSSSDAAPRRTLSTSGRSYT